MLQVCCATQRLVEPFQVHPQKWQFEDGDELVHLIEVLNAAYPIWKARIFVFPKAKIKTESFTTPI
jgi:hypothetical protein